MKKLYLAGQPYALQKNFLKVKGVEAILPVHAVAQNGEELYGVEITYNPKKQDICGVLEAYFALVDPFAKQEMPLQQSAVFYASSEDVPQLDYYARFLQGRWREPIAALGNLIVNDTMSPKAETRPLQLRFGRVQECHYLA